jgi:hypothetical protein
MLNCCWTNQIITPVANSEDVSSETFKITTSASFSLAPDYSRSNYVGLLHGKEVPRRQGFHGLMKLVVGVSVTFRCECVELMAIYNGSCLASKHMENCIRIMSMGIDIKTTLL